ncbi:hypothetical protein BS78_04G262100 [Paspalum vaginatum]|nr:hypothetical protein BS78_04G262100 [Paspalum vaginatum]
MEQHKAEEGSSPGWFSPAALLASWLARFCSGSDDGDEQAGEDIHRPTTAASSAARYLTYTPHRIKFA